MKRITKPTRWTAVTSTTLKDPRVDSRQLQPGQTHQEIVVTDLIDDLGQRWRQYGEEEPVMLGTPASMNAEED